MDLEMPGDLDGIAVTRQIRKLCLQTQVIVVTSHHQDEYIFPAARAGDISYLLKDVEPDELADVIRKAAQGEAMLDILKKLRLDLDDRTQAAVYAWQQGIARRDKG